MRARSPAPGPAPGLATLLALLVAWAGGCASSPAGRRASPVGAALSARDAPSEALRAHLARSALQEARAFRAQGRPEAAERAARRGLERSPHEPRLLRELARALDEQGRAPEAQSARAGADTLDPPLPPLPTSPLEIPSAGLLVLLAEPAGPGEVGRMPQGWPPESARAALAERLALRLPGARVATADPETLEAARTWLAARAPRAVLSLAAERVYCGESLKDGRFGVARLRFAAARPGAQERGTAPELARQVILEPREAMGCEREVLARALEGAFAAPELRAALGAPLAAGGGEGAAPRFDRAALHALFPGLGRRLRAELAAGEARLAAGELGGAREAFARAEAIDPGDAEVRVYVAEVEASLALSRELEARQAAMAAGAAREAPGPEEPAGSLDPRLSERDWRVLEALLDEERRRRQELLAALAALDQAGELPAPEALRGLHPVPLGDAGAVGPELARLRAGGGIEVRAAHAPDGALLARYYFAVGAALPVLREEDRDGDGRADRWIGYAGRARREVWEDARGSGRPDVHLVFAREGASLERIELDPGGDGEPDRIFYYSGEDLVGDARDSDGDGRIDRFDRFDSRGDLSLVERDVDGDGRIDVRSHYEAGRLVRRETSEPPRLGGGS